MPKPPTELEECTGLRLIAFEVETSDAIRLLFEGGKVVSIDTEPGWYQDVGLSYINTPESDLNRLVEQAKERGFQESLADDGVFILVKNERDERVATVLGCLRTLEEAVLAMESNYGSKPDYDHWGVLENEGDVWSWADDTFLYTITSVRFARLAQPPTEEQELCKKCGTPILRSHITCEMLFFECQAKTFCHSDAYGLKDCTDADWEWIKEHYRK